MGRGLVLYRPAEVGPQLVRAAQYVRMSREHQRYSPINQKQAIADYAAEHGFIVVRTYADEGKSGLTLRDRKGLTQLLDDATNGRIDYKAILVLDVSRWGRFQDTDESAAYEYLCRRAGVRVIYCAEPFPSEPGPLASMMKAVKRSMAGEFSRDLSTKVHRGLSANAARGFFCGGAPAYGLRRQLLGPDGDRQEILKAGQQKVLSTSRVILVPGSPKEVATVRRIFRLYVREKLSCAAIAKSLNAAGVRTARGNAWRGEGVLHILTNERYIGTNVYNRTSAKLRGVIVQNDPCKWVRAKGAFEPLVPEDLFDAAQLRLARKTAKLSRTDMLDRLRDLVHRTGRLSAELLERTDGMPGRKAYARRFGSLTRAYELVGYPISRVARGGETSQRNYKLRKNVQTALKSRLEALGFSVVSGQGRPYILCLDKQVRVGILVARRVTERPEVLRWNVSRSPGLEADLTIAVCASAEGEMEHLYLLPGAASKTRDVRLGIPRRLETERYRCGSFDQLYEIAQSARASGRPLMSCFREWAARLETGET
jgi:DNA invertase Pin-like site-specific DNA recombinase